MSSQRQLRVAEELRHVLSGLIQRGDFPEGDLHVPVTISRVDISPDLQNALVFFMPLGGLHTEETLEFLRKNSWFLRKGIGGKMQLRRVPYLQFIVDDTFDAADRMNKLFQSL